MVRTHLLASRYFDRHSDYVAMNRHRQGADIYISREQFTSFRQLMAVLERACPKDVTLVYANVRGFSLVEGNLRLAASLRLAAMEHYLAKQAKMLCF